MRSVTRTARSNSRPVKHVASYLFRGGKMASELERLIELARHHQITPEEHDAQVRSFAFGNTHFENPTITRADIDKAVDTLQKDEEPVLTL